MSPGGHYVHPPSLREFLDGGGDLSSFELLDSLVEAIVVARRLLPPETNRKQAARNRGYVERWFVRHGSEEPVPATQELLVFALWKAECLEDPSLAERFEAALPPDTLARALQLVDDLRHVHPLAVQEECVDWTCRACGETFGRGPAVVVTNTGDELGYDEDLTYCVGCISIAAAALEAASGIDRVTAGLDDEGLRPSPGYPESEHELVLVDEEEDELILDDEETLRQEAVRLTAQLAAANRRMAALEARRAALVRRLEEGRRGSGRRGSGEANSR
jgi:hypothetical protein